MSLAYLNGTFLPLSDAKISALDRGFTFGDGVYEVIPVFNGKVFRLDRHLQRLDRSLAAIYMENPLSKDAWLSVFARLIESVEAAEQSLYLQITRGVSVRDHDISLTTEPTVFAFSRPIETKDMSMGVKAVTHDDIRWQRCDIKAITLLPSVILRHHAKEQAAKEAILIREGLVTEGAASNVFVVQQDQIMTPPKDNHVLPGITRDILLEIMTSHDMDCHETAITEDSLFKADEIWLTSSTWEVIPVIRLDDNQVGNGEPGPMWQKANELYQEFKRHYRH